MKTLVIYDNQGSILSLRSGDPSPKEPVGVPFLWIEIPSDKYIESVDVSVTPHEPLLVSKPPSETDQIRLEMAESNAEIFELIFSMNGGM